ncbi:MAG: cytochrome c class [Betaproteobacteria bacterium]|nr:cytochrome c class [Betaproteobacteria bacterium]
MSDDHDGHSSPIKTPKQLITVVVLAFVVPIAMIVLLVNYVTGGKHGEDPAGVTIEQKAVDARIAPVAAYNLKDPSAPKVYLTGEQLFTQVCAACHATGAAGAPKMGDKAAWGPRIGQGLEGLFASVAKGKGAMPPRAGTLPDDVSDYELHRAIVYMANASGASLQEPAAPPATVAAAPAAAGAAAPAAAAATPAVVIPPPPAAAAAAPATADAGKVLYEKTCQMCHATGLAGAPKFGDKAAWAPHIAKGIATLYQSAKTGTPKGMPPKGTAMDASDADLKAAVDYMVNASK